MCHKVLLLTLWIGGVCFSQSTYYIDPNGSDSNNGKSQSTPWKTCARLNTALSGHLFSGGDRILFKRGQIWEPSGVTTGTGVIFIPTGTINSSQPITIGAYGSGPKPIISLKNSPTLRAVIWTGGFKNLVLRDLELQGGIRMYPTVANGGINGLLVDSIFSNGAPLLALGVDPASQNLENVAMMGDGTTPTGAETYSYGSISNVEVRYCHFHRMYRCWDMFAMNRNIWFHHNYITDCGSTALNCGQGHNITAEYNWFINTSSGGTGIAFKMQPQRWTLDSVVIRGNLIVFRPGELYASAVSLPAGNHVSFYNNTVITLAPYDYNYCLCMGWIYGSASNGSRMLYITDSGRASIRNYFIANNVLYGGVQITEQDSLNMIFWNGAHWYFSENIDSMKRHGLQFKNNIIYEPSSSLIMKRIFDKRTVAWYANTLSDEGTLGCYLWGGGTDTKYPKFITSTNFNGAWNGKYGQNDLNVDPLLLDIYGTDSSSFRPQLSSPALNNGIAIPGYVHDISGCPVPQSGTITIGCFQSVPVINPPISRRRLILTTPPESNPR